MNHVISLPDEVYQSITRYAARQGQTAEEAILAWARRLEHPTGQPAEVGGDVPGYDPAEDPLAEFLGTGELTSPDAIRRHDEAFAQESLGADHD